MTEISTVAGKLYLATVIDLYSRRLLGAATSLHPDAELACAALRMAVATRGGREAIWRADEEERVIFHTDRGSTYTATVFTALCRRLGSASPWAESGRASTPPPLGRSAPPWNARSSPGTTSTASPRPGQFSLDAPGRFRKRFERCGENGFRVGLDEGRG